MKRREVARWARWRTARTATALRANQVRPAGAKKLVGSRDDWRIRIGQYRIAYEIDDIEHLVTIYTVAKRSDADR